MNSTELIPIERAEHVTLYGKRIDKKGRLGRFEVHSSIIKQDNHIEFHLLIDAQQKMAALIGTKK